ncbi:Histone-lysine N-methyltransferase, H3 lysine-9 specific SUVH5 [Acorus gramineus]|uniref:Histone-lysine N-methyltransferase, H3 lysine-9 specific SUVH5 n=1 Tax=Acorus gramineus TaxID=55184 RepID=A0AAV9B738_ACOGR|nr:Histone-lysine N-methyltransferase, H3 lysine-9 specific SUVH5 [Acorus gramineus]
MGCGQESSTIEGDMSCKQISQEKDMSFRTGNMVARNKVMETLALCRELYQRFLQEQELKPKEPGKCIRVDFMVSKHLKEENKWVNTNNSKIPGSVPGIEIGDVFHSRMELLLIGLHRRHLAGIDFARQKTGLTLATSIVASGRYANKMNDLGVLIYNGSGGNPSFCACEIPKDQTLEHGNLALKNSMDAKSPVRVIYGNKKDAGQNKKKGKTVVTYVYDGLYLVEKYWTEKENGCSVFKFQLRRIPGQPELAEMKILNEFQVGEDLKVYDVSQGKENLPIKLVNTIDDEYPKPFTYVSRMTYASYVRTPLEGCNCINGCSDSVKCACVLKNQGEVPFNDGGCILHARPLVYECGPSCSCPPSCYNRVSQHGLKFKLEVFKTERMGWGVRSSMFIPSGSFICEYTGELLMDMEADKRDDDDYLFDIGQNYHDQELWEGLPAFTTKASLQDDDGPAFTIDAAERGNVGRFINHSCTPNLYAQNILYDHGDERVPHIMFFASEDIPPFQELTYHYNYNIGQVRDSDGKIKIKDCYCGSIECTGRLY